MESRLIKPLNNADWINRVAKELAMRLANHDIHEE